MRRIVKILKVKRKPRPSSASGGRGASEWMVMGALVASAAVSAKAQSQPQPQPQDSHGEGSAYSTTGEQPSPVVRFDTHLTFRLNGNNLADEQYVDRVGGGHYIPGPGRQVMISADVKY